MTKRIMMSGIKLYALFLSLKNKYYFFRKEIRRQKAVCYMQSKGIVLCHDELEDNF